MNKNDLKQKWSKFCNTDKLVDEVCNMYTQNGHPNSIHGVCVMLDKFFTQKEPLIEMFIGSKNYIGNLRIATKREFDRNISSSEISNFFYTHLKDLDAIKMLEYVDENGKTFFDYFPTGKNAYNINNLPSVKEQNARRKIREKFTMVNGKDFATNESYGKFDDFNYFMEEFKYLAKTTLPRDIVLRRNDDTPVLKKGTKTSRAFNAICHHYGVDKFNPTEVSVNDENGNQIGTRTVYPYNKIFAAYADLVSDIKRKMYFVISLNPLDYLTMSNGVSWKSCHNIYDGCYKGGVLSYMLDNTSMVTFVVNELDEPIYEQPKFYRQMFHYSEGMFMQNRLYPQGNDGATDLYEKFRGFMTEEFNELLHADGNWEMEAGTRACKSHVHSDGNHYKDYHSNNSCNIFYPIASKNRLRYHIMTVGHNGICAKCGKPYSVSGRLSHDRYDLDCKEE